MFFRSALATMSIFPFYVNIFSDLSGSLNYSGAEVIVSIYFGPLPTSTSISKVSHGQKYTNELS